MLLVVALEPPVPATATPALAVQSHAVAAKTLQRRLTLRAGKSPPPLVIRPPAPAQTGTQVIHEVIPAETLEDIAERYRTTTAAVAQSNGLEEAKPKLSPGQHLLIRALIVPEKRRVETYVVRSGDGWHGLAARYGISVQKLRAWNTDLPAGLRPGLQVHIWLDGDTPPLNPVGLGLDTDREGLPLQPIPPRAFSAGTPNRGRLLNGAQLPSNRSLYWRRRPEFSYGSTHMVTHLQLAIAKFRKYSGYPHELIISDMSQRHGGSFGRHESHRSGRDVDIWLPRTADVKRGKAVGSARQVDWNAAWHLVKALVRTGQVQYIFLSRSRQRFLYRAAKADGLTREQLRALMQYPRRGGQAVIRHEPGHRKHIHVRFLCGPGERSCR